MKTTRAIAFFAALFWFPCAHAQNLSTAQTSPAPTLAGQFAFSGANLIPPQYNTGKYPRLQGALIALFDAQQDLNAVTGGSNGEYLSRSIYGVKQAVADVELAMDTADGRPTPSPTLLPSLPPGLGNPSSGIVTRLTFTPNVPSPAMDAALLALATAQDELRRASPGNKGIFLPRAMEDVNFATSNALVAVNQVRGIPFAPPKPAPTASPGKNGNQLMSWGALAALVVVTALLAEMLLRKRQGREADGSF